MLEAGQEELLVSDVCQGETVTEAMLMARLKIKRYILFGILLAVLSSSYLLYSLNFKPRSAGIEDLYDDGPHQQIVVRVHAGDRMRHLPKDSQLHSGSGVHADTKQHPHAFQLFPNGLHQAEKRNQPGNVADSGNSDDHVFGDDRNQISLKNSDKEQKAHEPRKPLVKANLHAQNDIVPDQNVAPGRDKLRAVTKAVMSRTLPALVGHQNLHLHIQPHNPPKVEAKHVDRASWRDRVEGLEAGRERELVTHNDKKSFQLAINGVQQRKDAKDAEQNQAQGQKKIVDAVRMFKHAVQRGQHDESWQKMQQPIAPQQDRVPKVAADPQQARVPRPQVKNVVDAVGRFKDAGRRNSELLKRQNLRNDKVEDAGNQKRFGQHEVMRQTADVPREMRAMDRQAVKVINRDVQGPEVGLHRDNVHRAVKPQPFPGVNDERIRQHVFDKADNVFQNRMGTFPEGGSGRDKNKFRNFQPGLRPEGKILDNRNHMGNAQLNNKDHNDELQEPAPAAAVGHFHVAIRDLKEPMTVKSMCVPFSVGTSYRTVCVYPDNRDTGSSRQLIRRGRWEEAEVNEFQTALSTSPSLGALDLGAGLGVYTVVAASAGHRVVAVEPLTDNQQLFAKTMQVNSFTDRVVLVTDGLGEQLAVGRLRYPHGRGNMGAVYIQPVNHTDDWGDVKDLVRIIRLDDVLPLLKFSSAVVKLDVQGDDCKVLRGASKFFAKVDVQYVLMHWLPLENRAGHEEAKDFLRQRGFEAAHTVRGMEVYSDVDLENNINFVVWRKRNSNGV